MFRPTGRLVFRATAWVLFAALALVAGSLSAAPLRGHDNHIRYNADKGLYILTVDGQTKRIPKAEAERSLSTVICGECHKQAVAQLKHSVHFSTQGPNPRILFPGGGAHGALDRACGLPGTSALINYTSDINLGECGKCHVGRFIAPMEGAFTSSFMQMFMANGMSQQDAMQLAATNAANIVDGGLDCLICHAEHYQSVRDDIDWNDPALAATHQIAGYAQPGEPSPSPHGYANEFRDNTDFDHDGQPDLLIDATGDGIADFPLMIDSDGDGMGDTLWPTVGQDRSVAAVLSVDTTDEHNCLRCHEHARTGYKRGTLFREGYDVHASVCFDNGEGGCAKNTCTACHKTLKDQDLDGDGLLDTHKFVRGHLVGGDLAAADYPPPAPGVAADPNDPTHLTCVQCHDRDDLTHKGGSRRPGVHADRHLDVIACETCHITKSGGITYSVYGHGGHLSFGRNADGLDTKLITADHMVAEEDVPGDVEADFDAYRLTPVLMWFNGQTSFLAQSLAIRGAPNAKITPFKPMANGMVMDGRFFQGKTKTNQAGFPYNKFSMYRFFANAANCRNLQLPGMEPFTCGEDGLYGNAEVFTALKLLGTITDAEGNPIVEGLTPEQTRKVTIYDLFAMGNPSLQTMAMMQAFPNLMNFSKTGYQYEHYMVSSKLAGELEDSDGNGIIDPDAPFLFDMLGAVNAGLQEFKGFNTPMFLPADYDWYPPMWNVSNVATMKLPDGSFMKLFLSMGIQQQLMEEGVPPEQIPQIINQLVGSYPSFSNGVTLGGHGITPEPSKNALGARGRLGCADCHGSGGVLSSSVPMTDKKLVDMPFPPPMTKAEMPVWQWVYYNVRNLVSLGVATNNEDVVAGRADIDISDEPANSNLVRKSSRRMVLNWFNPSSDPTVDGSPLSGYLGFRRADNRGQLIGTSLEKGDLTWYGGAWMPVLEPVTRPVPNYAVLGYARDELIWEDDDPRLSTDSLLEAASNSE